MSGQQSYSSTIFNVAFSSFSVSSTGGATAFDIFSLKASTAGRVEIREINLGQGSSNTSANQQLAIQLYRNSTALGGGATVTSRQSKRMGSRPCRMSSATAPTRTSPDIIRRPTPGRRHRPKRQLGLRPIPSRR